MKSILAVLAAATAITLAVAQHPAPMPDLQQVGWEVQVSPVPGEAGRYIAQATVTDLRTGDVVARPKAVFESGKQARVNMATEGKWAIEMTVKADGAARTALYEGTFTREGRVISRQRLMLQLAS